MGIEIQEWRLCVFIYVYRERDERGIQEGEYKVRFFEYLEKKNYAFGFIGNGRAVEALKTVHLG